MIVVGAGSAGVPLAVRLSENPDRRVALIEAGPHYRTIGEYPPELRHSGLAGPMLPGHPNNWAIPVELIDGGATQSLARGKAVGGSSTINGTVFERGLPGDFAEWAAAGNDEWTFEKVLPFFKKIETDLDIQNEWHGSSGPIRVRRCKGEELTPADRAFIEAAQAAGFPEDLDMNAPDSYGVGPLAMNTVSGIRQNVAHCYLEPALASRRNLEILPECFARRVVFEGSAAVGVEVDHQGERKLIRGERIALSAGAVKSAHLLMLSGVGPETDLRQHGIGVVAHSPGVGRNFTDHCVSGTVPFGMKNRPTLDPREHAALQVGMHYTAEGSEFENDLHSLLTANPHNVVLFHGMPLLRKARVAVRAMRAMSVRRVLEEARLGSSLNLNVILMKGHARGEIGLTSADPYETPRIQYHYLNHEEDLRRMRYGTRLMVSLITESEAFRRLGAKLLAPSRKVLATDRTLNAHLRRTAVTCIHMAGSCRMGPDSDEDAVVDQYCRVKGVEGLYVVDTSVWPQTTRRNANATAIMTGERAAVFLADD